MSVKQYKNVKNLKKENLRDNMTDIELVLNMLAEVTTKNLSIDRNPQSFKESKAIAKEGGTVAGNARKDIEVRLKRPVIETTNATNKKRLNTGLANNLLTDKKDEE